MFVDIEDFKSAIAVENMLTPYKKGRLSSDKKSRLPKEPITPEVCMQVLQSTNYARNINDMLVCIADLPPSEQAQFKDVVLSTFTQREQPDKKPYNIVLLGKKLAAANGFEDELAEAMKTKEGDLLSSASHVAKSFVTFENTFYAGDFSPYDRVIFLSSEKIKCYDDVKFSKNLEFPNLSDVDLSFCDLQNVHSILFKDGAIANLNNAKNLPPQLDFSHCSTVNLSGCDLSNQPNLRFRDGADINLRGVKNLPSNLDFSRCDKVVLHDIDLSNQPNLSFKDGAEVELSSVQNLPPNLDLSMCAKVNLEDCNLSNQPNLRFKDGAEVELKNVRNLSSVVDFSRCSEVSFERFNLKEMYNLRFKDGAKVNLWGVKILPPNLDFSHCSEVFFEICNFENVEYLKFKNREQMDKSGAKIPDDWKGKLVFADEQTEMKTEKNINEEKTVSAQEDDTPMAIKTSISGNRWGGFIGKIFAKGGR